MTLEELLTYSPADIVKDARLSGYLVKYYRQIFDNEACFCGSKYEQYYYRLKIEGLKAMKNQQECDFRLKTNGALPMSFGSSETISNVSMTNDKALKFLKANKNRINLFSKYPENWKELFETSTEQVNKEDSEPKEDDVIVVTSEDLDNNPELLEAGIQEGDEIQLGEIVKPEAPVNKLRKTRRAKKNK